MRLPAALEDRVHLRSVTLRSVGDAPADARIDALRARLSLERALAAADARAAGLPPEAVLIVRRMSVRSGGASGPLRASGEMALAQQVDASLRTLARAARRPWREGAVGDAVAVWFADAHELAACLLRDWLRGEIAMRWWWRSLLGNARAGEWLQTQVLDDGAHLPATVARLADLGLAVPVIARLTPAQAQRALHALVQAHALPSLLLHDADATATQAAALPSASATVAVVAAEPIARRVALAAALPEPLHDLPARAQRLLCASALLAVRAPALLRSEAAAQAVVARFGPAQHPAQPADALSLPASHLSARAASARLLPAASSTQRSVLAPETALRADSFARAEATDLSPPQADAPSPAVQDSLRSAAPAHAVTVAAQTIAHPETDADASNDQRAHTGSVDSGAQRKTSDDSACEDTPPALPRVDTPPAPTPRAAQVEATDALDTDFGGLLYLLNVALSLGLYADFTQPRAANLALSPWDLLALLGRHWFGDALLRDPLWPQLARLAGRDPRTAPGAEVPPPSTFAPDDAALRPWAPLDTLCYRSGGTRSTTPWLALLHPDGFTLALVPRDPARTPRMQAQALCAQRVALAGARLRACAPVSAQAIADMHGWAHAAAPAHAPTPAQAHPHARGALARWLHACEGFLCARLALALDCTPAQAPALLCRHPARLRCGPARVEAMFALSSLPLAVRIAGLDRDPGWIPAAGRDVRFHFS